MAHAKLGAATAKAHENPLVKKLALAAAEKDLVRRNVVTNVHRGHWKKLSIWDDIRAPREPRVPRARDLFPGSRALRYNCTQSLLMLRHMTARVEGHNAHTCSLDYRIRLRSCGILRDAHTCFLSTESVVTTKPHNLTTKPINLSGIL